MYNFYLLQKVAYRLNGYILEEFNMDSKAKCDQLNLTHVARKKYKTKNKTNKRQCPFSSVQVQECVTA